jgi:hypothetical protein
LQNPGGATAQITLWQVSVLYRFITKLHQLKSHLVISDTLAQQNIDNHEIPTKVDFQLQNLEGLMLMFRPGMFQFLENLMNKKTNNTSLVDVPTVSQAHSMPFNAYRLMCRHTWVYPSALHEPRRRGAVFLLTALVPNLSGVLGAVQVLKLWLAWLRPWRYREKYHDKDATLYNDNQSAFDVEYQK